MNKIITLLILSHTIVAYSQVGVNTESPKATMDVSAKRDSGGNITDNTQLIGLQAPRITRAELTANTAAYGINQQGALIYITDVSGGTATGQRINMDTVGYYSFDGSLWQKIKIDDVNIYNKNGTLTGERTLTQAGSNLIFSNIQNTYFTNTAGIGIRQDSGTGTRSSIGLYNGGAAQMWLYSDTNAASQLLATGNSSSLLIGTTATSSATPITFITSSGANAVGTEKMRISTAGNIGINVSTPTEKLDNNGITRLRTLPLNGTANAINTNSAGNASATQDQTFIATRTLVADANGVLGYVNGVPTDPGVPKVLVSASVPRNQNIKNTTTNVTAEFSTENLDPLGLWTNNIFTVPAGASSLYIISVQVSNKHTVEASSWYTVAYLQRSTDGGATYTPMLADARSNMLGADVDNGNILNWTGTLNAGDKVRVRFNCSATADNIVDLGSITITRLAQ